MARKALISRFGAFGDIIHMSHLPRLLKDQGYDVVDVETNWKGYQLLGYNPFIDNLTLLEPTKDIPEYWMHKHWDIASQGYDKFINLYKTLEYNVCVMENQVEYYMSSPVRRNRYFNLNFYDIATTEAGYPELCGHYLGEIFYPQSEVDIVESWMKQFEGKWVVMINVCGTGYHKELVNRKEIVQHILDTYPDAHIIVTGGKELGMDDVVGERITSIIGKFPFRQALLIARYVDLMIVGESGIGVGAAMWGTPTIQYMTAASWNAHCKYAANDFSLQADIYCSPCHKGPYKYIGCPSKNGKPLCAYQNLPEMFEQIRKARNAYESTYVRTYPNSAELSVLCNAAGSHC